MVVLPLSYKLIKDGTVVVAHASRELSLDCFLSMQKEMRSDADLKYPHDTYLDVRAVTHIKLTENDIDAIARGLTSDPKTLGANRLAIVAEKEQAFELGRKYQTVEKGVDETVIMFFSPEIAKKWLGIQEL